MGQLDKNHSKKIPIKTELANIIFAKTLGILLKPGNGLFIKVDNNDYLVFKTNDGNHIIIENADKFLEETDHLKDGEIVKVNLHPSNHIIH